MPSTARSPLAQSSSVPRNRRQRLRSRDADELRLRRGRLAATPQGVDLSGEWRLNENLSDDPQRIDEPKELPPKAPAPSRSPGGFGRPGTTMPGMPSGPGSIDPGGQRPGEPTGDNLPQNGAPAGPGGFVPVLYAQDAPLPSSSSDSGPGKPAAKSGPR